jgi:hypothetical protein
LRPLALLVACLAVLAGCSPAAPPSARVAQQPAPSPEPATASLQHFSDSDEWFPFEQFVVDLLLDEHFASLDSVAATFGPETPSFRDGSSRERHYYLALAGENFRISKGQRARFVGCLKRWRAERPDSRAGAAGYACAMVKLAWDERGAAVARNVSDEQFSRFEEDLALAWGALEPTARTRGNVGGWYMAALRVGLGQGWERGRLMQLRNDCLRDAPWIESVEGMVTRALLPRWGGEPGEAERFASAVASSSPDGRGPQRYAWIVTSLQEVNSNVFEQTGMSWPTAHAGFEALEREHPESVTLPSRHAKFAWLAGDRDVARAAFARLGDRVDLYVWTGDAQFLAAREWANAPPS